MGLLDIIKGKKATNINDTTPIMKDYKHYKKATNINDTTPIMKDYKHYKKEEITKLEEQLLSIYNFNSAINYTNSSYVFPHQLILDKLENWLNDQVDNKIIPIEERIIYSKVLDKLDQLYNE